MDALPTLESVIEQFTKIETSTAALDVKVKETAVLMERQGRMLMLTIDELVSLSTIEAIPLFFRKRIVGVLMQIREIGFPS